MAANPAPGGALFSPPPLVLLADIGGTFARFGLAQGDRPCSEVFTLARSSAADLPQLCALALQHFGQAVHNAAIALAAPVAAGRAHMTNVGWDVDERHLAEALSLERVLLINDFAALALSLPTLTASDLLPVPPCAAAAVQGAPRVIFGPGTGLGVAVLVHHDGRPIPLASEGGHIGFAPASALEQRLLEHAAAYFERVSWERILSGPGLELIDEISQSELGRRPGGARSAAQIIDAARQGSCAAATHSLACFAGLLGSFGGDLALMFQASGGVVIGGGIVAQIAALLPLPTVRQRFAQKGRFSGWLNGLPLSILRNPNTALNGAARAFAERFPETRGTPHELGQ